MNHLPFPRLGESSTVFSGMSHLLLVPFSLDLREITEIRSHRFGQVP